MDIPPNRVHEHIGALKESAVSRLIQGIFVLALVAVPVSVSRAIYTGWQPAYTLHIVALCLFGVMYFLPDKLSLKFRMWAVLCLSSAIAIAGILNYGTVGNGMLWAMFSLMMGMFFLNLRVAYMTGALLVAVFVFSMYRFVFQGVEFPGGADVYVSSFASWATTLFGSIIFIVLIAVTIAEHRREVDDLLLQVTEQNQMIEAQKKQIEFQANHDALTGLPSLRLADDRLDMALKLAKRQNSTAALLFIDLDGFKQINDSFGHGGGDHVLKETANRIHSEIRESDTPCRIGGDEFLVVLNQVESERALQQLCRRLVKVIGQPIEYMENTLQVSTSIGAAISANGEIEAEALRRLADSAMYEVKKAGKNNFKIASRSD